MDEPRSCDPRTFLSSDESKAESGDACRGLIGEDIADLAVTRSNDIIVVKCTALSHGTINWDRLLPTTPQSVPVNPSTERRLHSSEAKTPIVHPWQPFKKEVVTVCWQES